MRTYSHCFEIVFTFVYDGKKHVARRYYKSLACAAFWLFEDYGERKFCFQLLSINRLRFKESLVCYDVSKTTGQFVFYNTGNVLPDYAIYGHETAPVGP